MRLPSFHPVPGRVPAARRRRVTTKSGNFTGGGRMRTVRLPAWARAALSALLLAGPVTAPPAGAAEPSKAEAAGKPARSALSPEETRLAYERGDCEAAVPGLEAAVAAHPGRAVSLYQLGFCLDRLGRNEEAAAHKKRATELFEREAAGGKSWEPFYYLAAMAALDKGDTERARAHAREGLMRLPAPERLDGVACFRASRLAGFAEKPDETAAWMRRAAERFMSEKSPPVVYAIEAFQGAGGDALAVGENERARDWLERAGAMPGALQDVWLAAGVARLRLGDGPGALANFRRVSDEPLRTETQYAVKLLEKAGDLKGLPKTLPDGRAIEQISGEDFRATLRSACAGEMQEASRPAALALLVAQLRRAELLRETALAAGCIDLLFR